jgi:NAD(P)-dependent dehydrogenase (short-subunit alcohol dehydrogenase family)
VADEIVSTGGVAIANSDDISDWNGAENLIVTTIEKFGGLDVLVNNAGIIRDRTLANMGEDDWDAVIRVHLKGTFAPTRHAAAYWRERSKAGHDNDARIINTTSAAGLYGNVGQANYNVAKAGIAAFTVTAARELGRYGVTANAIAPGAATRLTTELDLSDELKSQLDPTAVAPLCVWLASSLSADVTEQVIEASGRFYSVVEGWHQGPTERSPQTSSIDQVDSMMRRLLADARPHATMHERG